MEKYIFSETTQGSNAATKIHLLQKAHSSFVAGKEQESIYYQAKYLSQGIEQKYRNRKFRKSGEFSITVSEADPKGFEPKQGLIDLKEKCKSFPKEWTVIQLSKVYFPTITCLTQMDIIGKKVPVYATLFSYSGMDLNNDCPISFEIPAPGDDNDIFASCIQLPSIIKENLQTENSYKDKTVTEPFIQTIVDSQKQWLGPWKCLFSGKPKTIKMKDMEDKIVNELEQNVFAKVKFTPRQKVLSIILAKKLEILDPKEIYEGCCQFLSDINQLKSLFNILISMKTKKIVKWEDSECFPCILIVDQYLDSCLWEMMNPRQEICRVNSFSLLCYLFEAYRDDIKEGYLNWDIEKTGGSVIINPDGSLPGMETRLKCFYESWLPTWKYLVNKPPTETELKKLIIGKKVFCYNGHGSGIQYFSGDEITKLDLKAVIFLFGCDSVRLTQYGWYSEMSGSHLYYNIAMCPAVIGSIWLLTDSYTDSYARRVISTWINTTNKNPQVHSSNWDKRVWKDGRIEYDDKKFTPTTDFRYLLNNNLLNIMSAERLSNYPLRIRASFVLRGLPIKNCSIK